MIISLIAAVGRNNVIGADNKLPWRLPADMKRFVALTKGKPVIMGRRTFESLGKPLKNRINIVMTSDKDYRAEGCVVVHSVSEVLKVASGHEETVVIGGASVYKQFLPLAHRIYMTMIAESFDGDTYFPEFNPDDFEETEREEHAADENNPYNYTFVTLDRK